MGSLSSWTIDALERKPGEKWNFGATITGLDLSHLSTDDASQLRDAVWRHKVVIVKGNHHIEPKHHGILSKALTRKLPMKVLYQRTVAMACSLGVDVFQGLEMSAFFGKGFQGEDHYGFKNLTVDQWLNHGWHVSPPSQEDFENGTTRFQRWHFDAKLYEDEPTWFTCLRIAKQPHGRNLTVEWADGSGLTMQTPPGQTAFFSSAQLYEMLTLEEKQLVDHSWVEYAPHPFKWIEHCKSRNTGLGIAGGGHLTEEELPKYDAAKVKKVHTICVRKMYLRSSVDEQPRVINDIEEIHDFLLGIQHRVLRPEYILLAPAKEGDMIIWDNYSLFHTAIDYPEKYGTRSMHKADTGGSIGPKGPVPIPAESVLAKA